ncbi:MAG: hypothetical protein WCQ45_03275 [bacterium]
MATEEDDRRIADEKARDQKMMAAAAGKATSAGAPDGTVMNYEEGEESPLAGTWSFTEMRVSFPSDQTGKRLGSGTWSPQKEPQSVTILKQGQGYAMTTGASGTSEVTFDGMRMTLEYSYPTNSARYAGVLEGDTIVGTQHLVLGPDVYDGPWTATRAK